MRDYVTRLVAATDSLNLAERDSMRLPALSASQVQHVTDARTCRTAGEKMLAVFPSLGALPPTVRVFKASSVYVVEASSPDPLRPDVGAVFDLKWVRRETYIR